MVQESVADLVVDKLKRRLGTLRVGDPLDKNTDLGAINNARPARRRSAVSPMRVKPRERCAGLHLASSRRTGFWFPPTVFTGVSQAHRIAQEEIFGPVLSVLTFRTPEEAVAKANNTVYGLSAGVWTGKGQSDLVDGRSAPRRSRVGEQL